MRALVLSDLHNDHVTDGYIRQSDVETVVLSILGSETYDTFFFLGDLSDPFSDGVHEAMAFSVEIAATLAIRGIRQVWLTGNHDVVENTRSSHTLKAVKALGESTNNRELIRVFDRPGEFEIDGIQCLALPYTPMKFDYEPTAFVEKMAKCDLVLGHLNIRGITGGSESTYMSKGRDVWLPVDAIQSKFPKCKILNGHYHKRQNFRGVDIPGSPVQFTHGEEENELGYLIVSR